MKLNERDTQLSVERSREQFDVVVVGAGQAGLAIGYGRTRPGKREALDFVLGSEFPPGVKRSQPPRLR